MGARKGWSQEGRREARLETQLLNKGVDPCGSDKADGNAALQLRVPFAA